MEHHSLVIIGSGPAAYTAAIYAARANLAPLLFAGFDCGPAGGQLMSTTLVENYPGFPQGISGPLLMERCKQQAQNFGTQVFDEDVVQLQLTQHPFLVQGSQRSLRAAAIIIATGATAKRLDVPGSQELWQKGISACAVCDGAAPLFRQRDLYVIGGGDTAAEEALFLTKFARRVFIVHRRGQLRASKIMCQRLHDHAKIEILWHRTLQQVKGTEVLAAVVLKDLRSGALEERAAGGLFFAIGHQPNTAFLQQQLATDRQGYLIVAPGTARTSVAGVFAAGDVQDPYYRQAVTAAGSGCMAALSAERWLGEQQLLVE